MKNKGIKKYKRLEKYKKLEKSPWDFREVQSGEYGHGIIITACDARWVLEIQEGSICKVYDCLTTLLYT